MITNYGDVVKNVRSEVKSFLVSNPHLKTLVLGVSGGIDSALVAVLVKPVCDELGITIIGRSITIESNKPEEILRAKLIGSKFCHNFKELDLTSEYLILKNVDEDCVDGIIVDDDLSKKIRMGNIKARIRMIQLYNLASKYKGLVLGTDNLSELQLGFFTLHGDHFDFCPIQYLWKTEVYGISQWVVDNELTGSNADALKMCIEAVATDGLGITNSDLNQILPDFEGTSKDGYKLVDDILNSYTYDGTGDKSNPVINRHIKSEFKRTWPIRIPREKLV